jgi:hypothetical protein
MGSAWLVGILNFINIDQRGDVVNRDGQAPAGVAVLNQMAA